MPTLTAGEECQVAAKTLSTFADPRQGAITAPFINAAMGIAIFKGDEGVAVVRLPTRGNKLKQSGLLHALFHVNLL